MALTSVITIFLGLDFQCAFNECTSARSANPLCQWYKANPFKFASYPYLITCSFSTLPVEVVPSFDVVCVSDLQVIDHYCKKLSAYLLESARFVFHIIVVVSCVGQNGMLL